ncbi:hypothetical protein EUGRSUZ_E02770 [Eucalyptus grandis]|uniref:Uncharacterized protein n=2 Tax=Eucalyptus grandis TaxID=71139 RepID=A0ACC3KY17_EUCGR|nr:hypothetical protein EUGRSUZ_E02770 [Eucalyptus grandis]
MECLWAVDSLDSLWFFSNVLSRARPLSPAAEAEETEEKGGGGGEPVKSLANGPEHEAARAKPVATTTEDSLPKCPRCRNLDAEVAELGVMRSLAVEAVGTPESAEEESKLKASTRRSKRRQRSKRMFRERRRSVLGELDLGGDGEDCSGFEENRFLLNRRRQGFGVASGNQAVKKMPPLSDGIAMREHLRSWAIAVACAVK